MADKRMFSQKIVQSDAFCSLSFSAQALYFHLNMEADDDGVIGCTNRIINSLCHPENEKIYKKQQRELKNSLQELIEKRFILSFCDGVCVIKHWKMMNNIKKDRYKPTSYQDIISELTIKENQAYTEKNGDKMSPKCLQNVSADGDKMSPECLRSIDKYSLVLDKGSLSIGECRGEDGATETSGAATPDPHSVHSSSSLFGKHNNVQLSQQELAKLKMTFPKDWEEKIDQMSEYLFYGGKADNHYELMLTFG